MTICRFSVSALALLAAASPAAGGQQPRPSAHEVRSGDTLWQLARRYLGDPFLWPQIYRLNTGVVEDPHWIYPGEVLQLAAGEGVQAVPSEDTPAPVAVTAAVADTDRVGLVQVSRDGEYPMPEFARQKRTETTEGMSSYYTQEYRPLRPGEFYSSGFLTEGQTLPAGVLLGPITPPQIRNLSERSTATLFTEVGIRPPAGATYAKGDTLTVYVTQRGFEGYGDIVIPTGMVRITGQSEHQYLGIVVAVFGALRSGQAVIPTERFTPGPAARAVASSDSLSGHVLGGRELKELKHPQNRLLIDLGRSAGVAAGDIFEIRRVPGPRIRAADAIDELMATGQVVRVGERSATVMLLQVISPDIPPGMTARRIARLPS
jgi:LysM repeat protein